MRPLPKTIRAYSLLHNYHFELKLLSYKPFFYLTLQYLAAASKLPPYQWDAKFIIELAPIKARFKFVDVSSNLLRFYPAAILLPSKRYNKKNEELSIR
jgi:hypothetical protein